MDLIKRPILGIEKQTGSLDAYRDAVRAAKAKTPFQGTDLAALFRCQSDWMISELEAVKIETDVLGERKEAFFQKVIAADPTARDSQPQEVAPPSDSLLATIFLGLIGGGVLAGVLLFVIFAGPFSGPLEFANRHHDTVNRCIVGVPIGCGFVFGALWVFAAEYEYRKAGGRGLCSPHIKEGILQILALLAVTAVIGLIVVAVRRGVPGWVWGVLWILCLPLVLGVLSGFEWTLLVGRFFWILMHGWSLGKERRAVPALAWRRASASSIDMMLCLAILSFMVVNTQSSGWVVYLACAVFLWCYYGILESKFATMGKLVAGLRVRKVGATDLSIARATARFAYKLLFLGIVGSFLGIPVFFALARTPAGPIHNLIIVSTVILMSGLVLVRFRYQSEHFYDKLAKCHVVRSGT